MTHLRRDRKWGLDACDGALKAVVPRFELALARADLLLVELVSHGAGRAQLSQ